MGTESILATRPNDPVYALILYLMKLGTKIITAGIAAVFITSAVALKIQHSVIQEQGVNLTRDTMRAAILQAENTRDSMSQLKNAGAFDFDKLLAEYKQTKDFRQTTLYSTIPVVAAWKGIEEVAKKENFKFRVPRAQPRNPANTPTPAEDEILKHFETQGSEEWFKVDKSSHTIVYARPIRLTGDCLSCHGNPANSPTGDGKDVLGFAMEGWKEGEVRGAFVLTASMDRVDKVVQAGMVSAISYILPIAAAVGLLFFLFARAYIQKPLARTVDRITVVSESTRTASREIATAGSQVAEGASSQAAALEETSASIEELSSIIATNVQHVKDVRTRTSEARESTESGYQEMNGVLKLINGASVTGKELSEAMQGIRDASQSISRILKTIDEIAFQTNILALNAAVEAARAGDAGQGFAVVAGEVRALAQRSADAARETAGLIEDCVTRSNRGHEINGRVAADLNQLLIAAKGIEQRFGSITEKIQQVDTYVGEIAQAAEQQGAGINQIATAVTDMDKVTQGNAAAAEESAGAAQALAQQSQDLRAAVDALRDVLEGHVTAKTETPAADPETFQALSQVRTPNSRTRQKTAEFTPAGH